ncbi:hypothetical protein BC831DRAFT_447148 [Entophlyctis helioformis]|nr:hypothetical protein BC831DRAFT_447148 [Entophlyctis helioformis]
MDRVRTGRLSFKGDEAAVKKKTKKPKKSGSSAAKKPKAAADSPTDGWLFCDTVDDINGPVVIATAATDPPTLVRVDDAQPTQLTLKPVAAQHERPAHGNDGDDIDGDNDDDAPAIITTLATIEPLQATQVLLAKRLPASTKITFKTVHDKYLASDKFGVVAAEFEAAGPAEEWEAVVRDDGIAFMSVFGKFLSVDTASGRLRADAESVGFCETFRVKCQAQNKVSARRGDGRGSSSSGKGTGAGEDSGLLGIVSHEVEQMRRFQGPGGRSAGVPVDLERLLAAKKQGTLNEELVIRRSKTKSDKFCK